MNTPKASEQATISSRVLELSAGDLRQAQRFNAFLNHLPRFHTGRRWNARLVQAALRAGDAVVPDFRRWSGGTSILQVPGRSSSIRLTKPSGRPRAMVVHFHGGAWIMGRARLEDRIAAAIAEECSVLVAAVEFRNAIDDNLMATINDCFVATDFLVANLGRFEVERIVFSGESSGAHLAMETLLHLQESGHSGIVSSFYAMCGAFDLEGSESLKHSRSDSLLISGPSALANLRRLAPSLPVKIRRGPIHAPLSGLPPALFICGELDPIVGDSVRMSEIWRRAGAAATSVIVPEAPHGFNRMPTRIASRANALARKWIGDTLSADR
jgi:acetyl esterase/lipase